MPLQDVRVLLIHDDELERDLLRTVLGLWGALVTATSAVETADASLTADVIVCDLESVEAAGSRLLDDLARVRTGTGRSVPLIALGATARNPALTTAFHACLGHPVGADELLAAVLALARR
jgi:CheY-like chemotaxis protein